MGAAAGRALPAELSSFVGRRKELAQLRRLLAQARLVTLVGVGGVGKSRIALRGAAQFQRAFSDGLCWVELAALTEPALVPAAVARGLGLGDERLGDVVEDLAAHLGSRRLLLVLDNCEHVLAASSAMTARLLRSCANLHVLATSREPLGVEGEVVYHVPPMGLPDLEGPEPGRFAGSDAVALFLERAQASLPGFQLAPANRSQVARLCRYLDGIPLAIELAAVRLRALGVEQILERLEGRLDMLARPDHSRPLRQQTLRATMDWSYQLLAERERVLWRRLAVFAGGFELEAAEQVCADERLPRPEVLDALVGLVDRSIVLRHEVGGRTRYRHLETVHQYGSERLAAAGEEAVLRRRHRDWSRQLAREAGRRWWGPGQREVLDRLEAESDNLRAALAHCLREPAEAEAGLGICADTWFFWSAQRRLQEGRRWMGAMLEQAPRAGVLRSAVLVAMGTIMVMQQDAAAAVPVLEEAELLGRRFGADATVALARGRLGAVAGARAQVEQALELTSEAVRLGRELGDPETLATVLSQCARARLGSGDTRGAIALYRECIDLCREAGERWTRLRAALPLAVALSDLGDHQESQVLLRDSLAMARDLDDERMMAWSIEGLAWAAANEGRAEEAALLLGAAVAVRGPEPASSYALDRHRTERCRSAALALLGERAFQRAWKQGARMDRAEALAAALGEVAGPEPRPDGLGQASPLSAREREIAALVARGLSNRAIAERLFISVRTAENHVSHILVKLGLRSRSQLVAWVIDPSDNE
jgi:non-specific serine/threonine protein kinase